MLIALRRFPILIAQRMNNLKKVGIKSGFFQGCEKKSYVQKFSFCEL